MICILSTGRSGTTFTARVLNILGVEIGHEKVLSRGIIGCNWYEFLDRPKYRGRFTERLHQVREPLACIRSMLTFHTGILGRIESVCGTVPLHPNEQLGRIHRVAAIWLNYNRLMANMSSWSYRLEDLRLGNPAYDNLCNHFDVPRGARPKIMHISREMNAGKKADLPVVSWEVLEKIDGSMADAIMEDAIAYGYTYEKQESLT